MNEMSQRCPACRTILGNDAFAGGHPCTNCGLSADTARQVYEVQTRSQDIYLSHMQVDALISLDEASRALANVPRFQAEAERIRRQVEDIARKIRDPEQPED